MNARHDNTRNAHWSTEPLGSRYVGYSFLLHIGVVLLVLVLSSRLWPWQRQTLPPAALEVHLVTRDTMPHLERDRLQAQEQAAAKEAARQRQAEAEQARKQAAAEQARKQAAAEEARKQAAAQAEQARKQAAAEQARKQAAEEARKQAAAEQARKQATAEQARKQAAEEARKQAAAKAEQARKQAAEEARKQAAAEEARKQAAAQAEQARKQAAAEEAARQQQAAAEKARAQREAAMRQELAQEQARMREARLAAARDVYLQSLSHQVAQHWLRPPDVSPDLTCVVQVQQTKTGEVIAAKVVRSSGHAIFDRSVEAAVLKASPLPTPPDPELFDPTLNVIFHADDLSS